MKAYLLKQDMPGLNAGSVFVHDSRNETKLGSPGCGCLVLAWDDGNCGGVGDKLWCAESHVLPGQMARETDWFVEVPNPPSKKQPGRLRFHLSMDSRPPRPEPKPTPLTPKATLKRKIKQIGEDGPVASMLANAPASHKDVLRIKEVLKHLLSLLPDDAQR